MNKIFEVVGQTIRNTENTNEVYNISSLSSNMIFMVRVSPRVAAHWITKSREQGVVNRPLNKNTVHMYARDMKLGHWHKPDECILILPNGGLGGGNHRCHAAVEADVSFLSPVRFNVPEEETRWTNMGLPQSAGGFFVMAGQPGSAAGLTKYALRLLSLRKEDSLMSTKVLKPSLPEVMNFFEEHKEDILFVTKLLGSENVEGLSRTILGGTLLYVLIKGHTQEEVTEFFNQLTNRSGTVCKPVNWLKRTLHRDERTRGLRMEPWMKQILLTKVWNRYARKGDGVRNLSFNPETDMYVRPE